eukprot:m.85866 g.85866  ORF g.85866 m.85866 type:complete len:53 (-) comp14743_c0_seq3:72-230(-)
MALLLCPKSTSNAAGLELYKVFIPSSSSFCKHCHSFARSVSDTSDMTINAVY